MPFPKPAIVTDSAEEVRALTPYERELIEPFVEAFQKAQHDLSTAAQLLAGESWRGARFRVADMSFVRTLGSAPPFAEPAPAEPREGPLSPSAES